ncbi:GntR family transcriptional regulator [Herbaspirillum rhizosphaerae]|uniref:GntR family transcriptional regulator n=1 Tax=Herbaspirillum rhizosphaerae TaxID=346179 RepID=UPI00067CE335|nr:GntR family transcriptional regulator [Herbaspirillum rhizosphaerae]
MTTSSEISDRILESVLAKRLLPGARLSEQQLATLFGCSRTIVREALTRLSVRQLVVSSVGSGWYIAAPTQEEASETFEARRVIETGLLRSRERLDSAGLKRLRQHLQQQRRALKSGDAGLRSFLLGDFHVCLAQCLGNAVLANTLKDLTARTTLIAIEHQSDADAAHSCEEHAQIVEALEAGNLVRAEKLMAAHLGTWHVKLPMQADAEAAGIPQTPDPLMTLQEVLQPLDVHGASSVSGALRNPPPKTAAKGRSARPPRST